MRQLEFNYNKPKNTIPDFQEWLYRVNAERRLWKERVTKLQ